MPLIHSPSKKAFEKNVRTEIVKGNKPQKQAVAIAYATKRAARKADGGMIEEEEDYDVEPVSRSKKSQTKYERQWTKASAPDKDIAGKALRTLSKGFTTALTKGKAKKAMSEGKPEVAQQARQEWSSKVGKGKPAPFKSGGKVCW